jgi:hypothetical protein
MGGPIADDLRRALYEAQQVRNTLAHRGGVADRRLTDACPWLKLSPGKSFTITHRRFEYYQQAIRLYVINVLNRFLREDGKPPITHDLKPLTDFADELQEGGYRTCEPLACTRLARKVQSLCTSVAERDSDSNPTPCLQR